ncbi:hypothetical protein GCK72_009788 [Caenorhabditis remanei]|uniref:Uncharacterized protein n=1 Tax=Caenorhabditis remanei TaxID=31234 RepID=A0A2P4UWX6_CAERE|nr:hypothetical protein GCK72_009788 [Caenorhabditis remanei]KAF1761532.1 hypothetical protein GCK72_009788 [Caenorhabditis remanei]
MTEQQPKKEDKSTVEKEEELPKPNIQKSIRQLPKIEITDDEKGEKLPECSEGEWDASDEPFSAELLNVKNAPNKVSVFSGPYRSKETVETIKKLKPAITQTAPTVDDRPDKLAQMMSEIFSEIINGNDLSKIKVTISTKIP